MRWPALLLFPASLLGGLVDGTVTVLELKGEGSGKGSPLAPGLALFPEAAVTTGKDSSTVLWLANGSKLTVTPEAEVIVRVLKLAGPAVPPSPDGKSQREASPSVTEIEVIRGKVVGDVKKLAPESVYALKTPVGTVRIKGTVFAVEFRRRDDGTAVFNVGCARGLVQVEMPGGAAPLAVKPGQQLSVAASKDGAPAGPPKMAPLPPSAEMKAAVASNGAPPPPPPKHQGPPPALDQALRNVESSVLQGQVNPSPTGG